MKTRVWPLCTTQCRTAVTLPIAGCLSGPRTSRPAVIVTCPGLSWPFQAARETVTWMNPGLPPGVENWSYALKAGAPGGEPGGGVLQPSGSIPVGALRSRSGWPIRSRRHWDGWTTTRWTGNPNWSCVITWRISGRASGVPATSIPTSATM